MVDTVLVGASWLQLATALHLVRDFGVKTALVVPPHRLDQRHLGYAGFYHSPDALYAIEQLGLDLITHLSETGLVTSTHTVLRYLHYPRFWGQRRSLLAQNASHLVSPQSLWHALLSLGQRCGVSILNLGTITAWVCLEGWHRVSGEHANLFSRRILWHFPQLPIRHQKRFRGKTRRVNQHFWLTLPQSYGKNDDFSLINADFQGSWWLRRLGNQAWVSSSTSPNPPLPLRHRLIDQQWSTELVLGTSGLPQIGAMGGNPTALLTLDGGGLALQLGLGAKLARCIVGLDDPKALVKILQPLVLT